MIVVIMTCLLHINNMDNDDVTAKSQYSDDDDSDDSDMSVTYQYMEITGIMMM